MTAAGVLDVLAGDRSRPRCEQVSVVVNRELSDRYRLLRFRSAAISERARAGQFVMLGPLGRSAPVLPRPMAIYTRDADAGVVDIVYGVVGYGTRALAEMTEGDLLAVTGPLGRGFVIEEGVERVLLVGRGVGICAMTTVAQDLAPTSVQVTAVLSGRNRESVLGQDVLRDCGADVLNVTDANGSSAVDAVRERLVRRFDDDPPQQILTSGSERLTRLAADLGARWNARTLVSVEAHMACGLGYCHGCAVGNGDGATEAPLVCRDGPVFGLRV
ncbi:MULTISPECIES: iron-sulfur cluster-binding protein [Prauserella salsuginis group]|uniref:Dihydroorotate oxidase electron transfer subunit n=1 Tax=Prauserella salsuginis TaxID=387889 RepID=A0ABW6G1C1_9PSEU|nr:MULTISPECIES: dihydroorotate oxidase electron transfer subunit [Prauserella salsuginis group]MCR3722102.1 dihydroorotate dehydrogenase electron transfer subunit [Prauserella flava]MCR3736099.1 dihydroorotate dehydrogenase electron transfer subunit [Prauserella salsuginis]